MSYTVEIKSKKHTFQKAENLRKYVMANGSKKNTYVYSGDSPNGMFIDRFGQMYYDKGWKVALQTGTVVSVDAESGRITEGKAYTVRTIVKGKTVAVGTYNTQNEAINGAVRNFASVYRSGVVATVTVSKGKVKLGTIEAVGKYPVFKDAKTKKIKDIYNDGSLRPHIDKTKPIDPTKFRYEVYDYQGKKISGSTVTAKSYNLALDKIIRSVGTGGNAWSIDILNSNKDVIHRLHFTERPIEPWGFQWTEDGNRDNDKTRNIFIRDLDGKVYYTYGNSRVAHYLNPPKKR